MEEAPNSIDLLDEEPVIVWMTDADGSCTFLNRRWYDFTGQTQEIALGTGWLKAVHPDDRAFSSATFRTANEKREPFRLEYRLRMTTGDYRWTIDAGAPRFGQKGEFLGFIGTVTDIHERKDAEGKLRISEERYRNLVHSIDEGFCVIELVFDEEEKPLDYRFLEINPVFEAQTGIVDPVGKTVRQLVPGLDKSWIEIYGNVALTGEPIRFENYDRAMNRWFNAFAFRVDRPEQRRVALLFNEITERKNRERDAAFLADINENIARAADQKEILETVSVKLCRHLDVSSVAFVEIEDPSGHAKVFYERRENPELPSLIGEHNLADFISESLLKQLRAGRTVAIPDVASDPEMKGFGKTYEALGVRSHIQGSYVSDGRWKFMLSVHHGKPRQWRDNEVAVIREVTALVWLRLERTRAEENLRELSRSLEHRVAVRTAELQEHAARLRLLAAELGSVEQRERKRLAALLHDNLQQLLVAANMHLTNANRRIKDDSLALVAKFIGEATDVARDLTRQIRPPALYEDGLVAALYGLKTEMAERHGLDVAIEGVKVSQPMSDDVNALLFDSIRELLFNVAKHSEANHSAVQVREEPKALRVMVEDEGNGFDAEATLKRRASAGGFGLFTIRERLAAIGGKLSITSSPGKGTRITLEVPFAGEAPGEVQHNRPTLAAKREKHSGSRNFEQVRLLVVDDHAMVRQGLSAMLAEDERIHVAGEAADGLEAIEAVSHHRPDAILIDVNMPRMNGVEATREIHRRWPDTIIVGLSVQDDEATATAMRNAGAAAFLPKAADSEQMTATILNLLAPRKSNIQV